MYRPSTLEPFPAELADSLLEQALQTIGLAREHLDNLSDEEKKRLDEVVWRLINAEDVSDHPCHD